MSSNSHSAGDDMQDVIEANVDLSVIANSACETASVCTL